MALARRIAQTFGREWNWFSQTQLDRPAENQVESRQTFAAKTGLEPGDFVHSFGDVHLYSNHVQQAHEQLRRTPKPQPRLTLNPDRRSIFDFEFEDFMLTGYDPDPSIKAEVAV